ncbi:hypothetical protein ACIP6Q_32945 [Streptomyces bobili]|uniref:hypothetical protein n=1 Tax=Streptomyces bobili TaxID=67280 RepID=UPI0037FE239F
MIVHLARHSREGEAIEVMEALAGVPGGAEDWILFEVCSLYTGYGRPEDGLVYLDTVPEHSGEEQWALLRIRLRLMAACDRVDEAIERAQAHSGGGTPYAASHAAELLAGVGRTEEAVAVLLPHAPANSYDLAGYLIDVGPIEEAVAVLHQDQPSPPQSSTTAWIEEPPF